jgi:Smg protein
MKEETVLNVLMYLFQNHMKNSCELDSDANQIVNSLEEAGFEENIIQEAISWLETLVKEETKLSCLPQPDSIRVLSSQEQKKLDAHCLGFILSLEQQGILSPETREIVINQVLALDYNSIDINLIKWVTLMVLYNQPNCDKPLGMMEFLVLDPALGGLH